MGCVGTYFHISARKKCEIKIPKKKSTFYSALLSLQFHLNKITKKLQQIETRQKHLAPDDMNLPQPGDFQLLYLI